MTTLMQTGTANYGVPRRHEVDATDTRALVESAQTGDPAAFGQLYRHYHETVFRFVQYRVGNRQTAEDIAADVFVRALSRLGQFTWQGKDFGAWLVTIARNLVFDYFKSSRYRLEVTTGAPHPGDTDLDRRGDPAKVAEVNNAAAVLGALLADQKVPRGDRLTPAERRILALRFGADLSVEETAQYLDMHVGAVKASQYRAVLKLRRRLQGAPL